MIKTRNMKRIIFLTALLIAAAVDAQKISFTAGLGIFREAHTTPSQYNYPENSGPSVILELHTAKEKHLLSLSVIYSVEFVLLSDSAVGITEINAMYGRPFPVTNFFQIEALAGIGYFHLTDPDYYYPDMYARDFKITRLAFPLRANFRFFPNSRFSFGVKANYNINSFSNVLSGHLYGTFRF